MILTDACVRVIVSSIQTNRARCALYKKILDLLTRKLDEETVSGSQSAQAKLNENFPPNIKFLQWVGWLFFASVMA